MAGSIELLTRNTSSRDFLAEEKSSIVMYARARFNLTRSVSAKGFGIEVVAAEADPGGLERSKSIPAKSALARSEH